MVIFQSKDEGSKMIKRREKVIVEIDRAAHYLDIRALKEDRVAGARAWRAGRLEESSALH
jgi:hypothetical protein